MHILFKYGSLLLFSLGIITISYGIERSNFTSLLLLVSICGLGYWVFLRKKWFNKRELLITGVLLRISLLFFEPNLSDDYYRFVWDGQMTIKEENPYLVLPKTKIQEKKYTDSKYFNHLYDNLNSKEYYTVYPPVNQLVFAISAYIGGESLYANVVVLKVILLIFEILSMVILFKLLRLLKLSEHLASIYVLNPLVILELVGNIHFEGNMLFFFLVALYFLFKDKLVWSALLMAFAINTKLIPLMILPLLIYYTGWGKSIKYYLVLGAAIIVMFIPFISSELLSNFWSSVDLYFQKFEFNASVYYVFRWVGLQLTGYNLIKYVGYSLPLVLLCFIAYKAFFQAKRNINHLRNNIDQLSLLKDIMQIFFLYYLLATIIHPWYVINLVILAVFLFESHKHILVWSVTVYLSYFAYSAYVIDNFNGEKHESNLFFLFVFIEYFIVFAIWFFQSKRKELLS